MIIKLPYPDSTLMPNRKNGNHWAKTVKAKDSARDNAYYSTLEVLKAQKLTHVGLIPLQITFVQSDKRYRDLDNLLAASKSALDGVAKALKIDDSIFEPITILRGKGEACMLVEINQ